MSLIGADDFDASSPQWMDYRASLLTGGAPSFVGGACRLAMTSGGSGLGLWFNTSTGYLRWQWVWGNFDVIADVQVQGNTFAGLPAAGAARLALIAVHDAVRIVSGSGLSSSVNEYHVGIGYVTGGGQDPTGNTILIEHKQTVNSVSTFNTISRPAGAIASAGRVWLRLRRVGSTITAFVAPIDPVDETRVPLPTEWTTVAAPTLAGIRTLAQVGFKIYSSSGAANVGGIFRKFANYNPAA